MSSVDASDGVEIGKRPTPQLEDSKVGVPTVKPPEEAKVLLGPAHDCEGVDGLDPTYSFDLDYVDQRGYRWTGRFAAKVLTIQDRAMVGLTRARMCAGMPTDSIDGSTINLFEMLAHLGVAIKDAPEWAKDLNKLYDLGVITAIYMEVASYEARFWGSNASEAG